MSNLQQIKYINSEIQHITHYNWMLSYKTIVKVTIVWPAQIEIKYY